MKRTIIVLSAALLLTVSPAVVAPAFAQKDCPPGLAKKNPPCVPPGQAQQGVTTQEWLNRHRIGDRIDQDEYVYLEDYDYDDWTGLPRLEDDEAYVVFDDALVVVDRTTLAIIELIRLFGG